MKSPAPKLALRTVRWLAVVLPVCAAMTLSTASADQDVRFTRKDDVLYAIQMLPSPDGRLTIRSLAEGGTLSEQVADVSDLASGSKVAWRQTSDGLLLRPQARQDGFPVVFRIVFRKENRKS